MILNLAVKFRLAHCEVVLSTTGISSYWPTSGMIASFCIVLTILGLRLPK